MEEQEKLRLFIECKFFNDVARESNNEAVKIIHQLEKLNLLDEFFEWYEGGMNNGQTKIDCKGRTSQEEAH